MENPEEKKETEQNPEEKKPEEEKEKKKEEYRDPETGEIISKSKYKQIMKMK